VSHAVLLSWLGALSIAALFSLHCLVLGAGVFHLIQRWTGARFDAPNAFLSAFLLGTAGLALNMMLLFVLGLMGLLAQPAIAALAVLPFLVAAVRMGTAGAESVRGVAGGLVRNLPALALVLSLFVLILWPAGGAPGYWDDTMYHLPLARHYVEHHAIVLAPYLRFPLFPQHMHLLLALGLMLGGVPLAQIFATLPLFFLAVGLVGCSVWLLRSPIWGVLATLALLSAPPVKSTWGYAYIDNGLSLFCWAAAIAMALVFSHGADPRQRLQWVSLSAWLAAAAASTKLFGGVFAILLGLQLWRAWRPGRAAWLYAGVLVTMGSVWYLRSFWISGDPVHPAGGDLFGYFLWDAGDLAGQKAEQALHGVQRAPWRIPQALATAGVGWWALALVGLVGYFRSSRPVRSLQLGFLIYLLFWFFVTQVDRYLAPIFGSASFLSVLTLAVVAQWAGARLPERAVRLWRPAASTAIALVMVAWALWTVLPQANYRMQHRSEELASRGGYVLMSKANQLAPKYGPRIVQAGFENGIYFFDGTAIGDWFGPGRYRQMLDCDKGPCALVDPKAMLTVLSKVDSRMLVVNTRRFAIDLPAYQVYFDLVSQTPDGVLLTLK